MNARVEHITPAVAEEMLLMNENNYRKMDKKRVKMFARDMANGEWELNGEAIKFNNRGELVDGQHRLAAIVEAGRTVDMLVIRGVMNNVKLFDMGKNRTPREFLLANGISPMLAEHVFVGAAGIVLSGYPSATKNSHRNSTKKEILDEIENHLPTWEAVARCVRSDMRKKGLATVRKSCVYAAVYTLLAYGEDEDQITEFIDVVKTGFPEDGHDCTSAIVLRNMLLSYSSRSNNDLYFSATMDAYYDFKSGRPRRRAYRVNDYNLEALKALRGFEE